MISLTLSSGDVDKCPFTPDRALITNQRHQSTQASLVGVTYSIVGEGSTAGAWFHYWKEEFPLSPAAIKLIIFPVEDGASCGSCG